MTFEEIKKLLKEYIGYKRRLKSEQLRVSELRSSITSLKAVDYGKECVKGSPNQSSYLESVLDRISVLEEGVNELMKKVFEIEDLIAVNMENLTPIEQAMIIDRYMHGYSWKKICREYHYAEREPFYIVEKAIKKMAKK